MSRERDWRFLKGLLVGLCVMALLACLPAHGGSRAVVHATDVQVRAANSCRPWLGASRFPVRRLYARSSSVPFRRYSFRKWRTRAHRCALEKRRVGVPPWFRSVMLCVHPKESSDWYLDTHHDGGLQFAPSTWDDAMADRWRRYHLPRFSAYAYQATPNEQIRGAWDLTQGSSYALHVHWGQTIGGCL